MHTSVNPTPPITIMCPLVILGVFLLLEALLMLYWQRGRGRCPELPRRTLHCELRVTQRCALKLWHTIQPRLQPSPQLWPKPIATLGWGWSSWRCVCRGGVVVGHMDRVTNLATVRSWVQLFRNVSMITRSQYLPSCSYGLTLVHASACNMQPPPLCSTQGSWGGVVGLQGVCQRMCV